MHMKLGSNFAVKNVLQVYVTTSTIFYAIFSKKMRTSHAGWSKGMLINYRVGATRHMKDFTPPSVVQLMLTHQER